MYIYIYLHVPKHLKEHVNIYFILYAGLGSKQKNFKQLPSNLSERTVCCLQNQVIFFKEQTYRGLDSPLLISSGGRGGGGRKKIENLISVLPVY